MTVLPYPAANLTRPRKREDNTSGAAGGATRNPVAASEINPNYPARVGDDWSLHVIAVKTPLVRIRVGFAGRRIGGLEKRSGAFPVTFDARTATLPAPIRHRAAAHPLGSVIRGDFLPATVLASASSVVGLASAPRWHFLLKLVWPFKAARRLIPSLLVKPAKQPSGGFSKCLRSFASAVFHDRNQTTGSRAWRAEKLSLSSRKWGVRS